MSRREYHYYYHGKDNSPPVTFWGAVQGAVTLPFYLVAMGLIWTAPVTVPLAVVTGFGVTQNYQDCGALVCDR